jgi:hypothetical protein
MTIMVADHQSAIESFEQQAEDGQAAALVTFAEETLPVLQDHLDQAQQTEQQISAAGDGAREETAGGQEDDQAAMQAQEESAATEQSAAAQSSQQVEAPQDGEQAEASIQQEGATPDLQTMDLVGNDVLNSEGSSIGEIEDVVIDQEEKVYAVISVGGFLGIGEKQVALPLDELHPNPSEGGLSTAMTEDELEGLPAYQEGELTSIAQR